GVERLEDDTHAPMADDLDNLEVSQAAEMRGVLGALEKIEGDLHGYSRLGVRIAGVLHVALEGPEGSPVGGVCRRPSAIDVADDVRQGPAAGRQLVERLLAPLAGVQVAGQLSLLLLRQSARQQPWPACRIW